MGRGSGPPTLRDRNPMIGWDPLTWRRLESLVPGLVWYPKLLWEAGTPSHQEIGLECVWGRGQWTTTTVNFGVRQSMFTLSVISRLHLSGSGSAPAKWE